MRSSLETGALLDGALCGEIFAPIVVQVCDGGTRKNVMKKSGSAELRNNLQFRRIPLDPHDWRQ